MRQHRTTVDILLAYAVCTMLNVVKFDQDLSLLSDLLTSIRTVQAPQAQEFLEENADVIDLMPQVTSRATGLGQWLHYFWPLLKDREDLTAAKARVQSARDPARSPWEQVQDLRLALADYAKEINVFLKKAAPASFRYGDILIHNPRKAPDEVVQRLLAGLHYVKAMFKKRGVLPLLEKTLGSVILRPQMAGETAAGLYQPRKRVITVMIETLDRDGGGRHLADWVNEVFIHEVGHHIDLDLMDTAAQEEWRKPWREIEEGKKETAVTPKERQTFFKLLVVARGDLRAVSKKLRGMEKVKFHTWLRQPLMSDAPFVTDKQLRWANNTEAQHAKRFLADPDGMVRDSRNPDKILNNIWENLRYALRVDHPQPGPFLTAVDHDLVRDLGSDAKKAIEALEMPSDYAKTNEREDFAETFVLFMENPDRLSSTAKLRMQRALHQSGLYGKPIMKVVGAIESLDAALTTLNAGSAERVREVATLSTFSLRGPAAKQVMSREGMSMVADVLTVLTKKHPDLDDDEVNDLAVLEVVKTLKG